MITTRRGQLTLVNRAGIEQVAGSFYGMPEAELKRLLSAKRRAGSASQLAYSVPRGTWFVLAMLPPHFQDWFAATRLDAACRISWRWSSMPRAGESVLLVAPTGGGKTLAGFLPSLIDLAGQAQASAQAPRLHTLYISPLKALAVDVARNLETPIAEMDLPVTVETRTGDTPAARRQRQRHTPARHSAHHAGTAGAADGPSARADKCSPASRPWCWTNCMRSTIPSAAICWRWGWRGCRPWRPAIAASACPRR